METPNRKRNRLDCYDYSQNGCYFVTLCTQNRTHLFKIENPTVGNDLRVVPRPTNDANQIIHTWVQQTENKFDNITIDKYVIMSDHLHFLINIKERHAGRSLPDVMRYFKTMTTNEYIRGVKAEILPPFDKKLWQKSYYDHVIRNQQDYNEVWEYIENNPKKWELMHL